MADENTDDRLLLDANALKATQALVSPMPSPRRSKSSRPATATVQSDTKEPQLPLASPLWPSQNKSSTSPEDDGLVESTQPSDHHRHLSDRSMSKSVSPVPSDRSSREAEATNDWATFMSAYAMGRWDPRQIPLKPVDKGAKPSPFTGLRRRSPRRASVHGVSKESNDGELEERDSQIGKIETPSSIALPTVPFHPIRNSFGEVHTPGSVTDVDQAQSLRLSPGSDMATHAAAMRWAGAHVNIAPFPLPSPEHEYTDPLRGYSTTLPRPKSQKSHPHNMGRVDSAFQTKKSRFDDFWAESPARPEIIAASVPVAPALLRQDSSHDYFSDQSSPHSSAMDDIRSPISPNLLRRTSTPNSVGVHTVPAMPRKISMPRQYSSPLPSSPLMSRPLHKGHVAPEVTVSKLQSSRATKEEKLFKELGYLAPPDPTDEWERRRALNKFNIWATGPDLAFDRIVHLAKLVFHTKGVFISLIDGQEQWLKSTNLGGMALEFCLAKKTAFCSHAILQRGDEPMIILDSILDWRFAQNPLVQGEPGIRFYAAAPLRTQDGFNIGSLALIDDHPRDSFTPRQRHALREFAAIAMRELELWRDKIQLRIRDRIQRSMETFSRECLEIDAEVSQSGKNHSQILGTSMERIYDRAAKLVKSTLDVDDVMVMDVSHCETIETMNAESNVSIITHHAGSCLPSAEKTLTHDEFLRFTDFFEAHPDGKVHESVLPTFLRPFVPISHLQYALTVPIFNIDKRPFALLFAYNASNSPNRYLEGHELSYLRAIGVIILSAVLKRRMILADKAKSLFISNISHELRTPLHGILAAAELLGDTPLTHNQIAFLQTVQACGTSLVETVNHVLDFTKLSGNQRSGGVEHAIARSKVDLMQLVEEAVDGGWIGYRARAPGSEIGTVYSPPITSEDENSRSTHVETVVDIGLRESGWILNCEKGGIRRVLMNLLGNSLKFTSRGFVHVSLRELPLIKGTDQDSSVIRIELAVRDSGKGISQHFLKNQLFHPFSQENPLQTGTGLGLAIVNSIVQSDSVAGTVDVTSEEGVGTDIRITFPAEAPNGYANSITESGFMRSDNFGPKPSVALVGFSPNHRGESLLRSTFVTYLSGWWGFELLATFEEADIVVVNEDINIVSHETANRRVQSAFIVLTSSRGDARLMHIASEYEAIGGFCRILFKPGGPSRLKSAIKVAVNFIHLRKIQKPTGLRSLTRATVKSIEDQASRPIAAAGQDNKRSHSDFAAAEVALHRSNRPAQISKPIQSFQGDLMSGGIAVVLQPQPSLEENTTSSSSSPTMIAIGSGGSLLRASIGALSSTSPILRVLIVEDNVILRNLLVRWLRSKGHQYAEAADGQDGVNILSKDGPFDVILLDMSMPNLDGIGAASQMRQIESSKLSESGHGSWRRSRILALTGMSSLEDKKRAFEAGVDGYLVKPVAFKTLDEMLRQLRTASDDSIVP